MMDDEQSYVEGSRRAWMQMLQECLKQLGEEGRERHGWVLERQEAVAQLRAICQEHGDNDWPDDLHLGDVIEKHLRDHLEARRD